MMRAEDIVSKRANEKGRPLTVLAVVAEPFTHGASRERREVLQWGGLAGSGGDDDGVLHRVVLLEGLDELGDGGTLLTDSDIDTVELLGLILAVVPALLVKDGVDRDSSLAGLTITDNQFTLATADGHHGVDGLKTSHHGLIDGATGKNAGGFEGRTATLSGLNGALAVDGVTEGVDDTSKQVRADGDIDNLAGTLDSVALLDKTIVSEDGDTDIVGFEIETHAAHTRGEFHHLFGCKRREYGWTRDAIFFQIKKLTLDIPETPDTADTVTDACSGIRECRAKGKTTYSGHGRFLRHFHRQQCLRCETREWTRLPKQLVEQGIRKQERKGEKANLPAFAVAYERATTVGVLCDVLVSSGPNSTGKRTS
jgi:hypothetical protein